MQILIKEHYRSTSHLSNHSASTATNIKIRAVDPDPAFWVNSDPDLDPILIQGFDDQKLKQKKQLETF